MNRSAAAKRAIDVVLALLGLVVTSPLVLAIWLRIRLDRDGPALYRGVRTGLDGMEFRMLKFRTMTLDAERVGGANTPDGDDRVTATGRRLRRYKLDELPQLVNVLTGDMSLVGPRPQVPEEVADYSAEERIVLSVRPGITDWASLRFHNEGEILSGHADPGLAYAQLIRPEKMRLAMEYAQHWTLLDDFRILTATLLVPLRNRVGDEAKARA